MSRLAGEAMNDATSILGRPDTGPEAIAAETEAIEILLQAERANPKSGGGGGGSNPGGGGTGDTDASLALELYGPSLTPMQKLKRVACSNQPVRRTIRFRPSSVMAWMHFSMHWRIAKGNTRKVLTPKARHYSPGSRYFRETLGIEPETVSLR